VKKKTRWRNCTR